MGNSTQAKITPNKALQRDTIVVSHLLQSTQKLHYGNSALEQRRYV